VKWGGGHVDFVAVDPQVAVAQTTIGVGFETQAWQGHDVAPEKRAGVYRVVHEFAAPPDMWERFQFGIWVSVKSS